LVVWAHPSPESFSHALLRSTVGSLERAGHDVTTVDLYGERYEAAMSEQEWLAYRDGAPDWTGEAGRHAELARTAEQLVFVYPTWWFGLPAVLKGWLERTMAPGVAFRFDDHGKVVGNLTALRRVIGVTTYGSAPWYVHLIGDAGRRTLTRCLRLSAPSPLRVRTRWLALYRMDTASDEQRRAFLGRVERRLAAPTRRRAGRGGGGR
jgi:putative NADPH-quinone reductase